MQKKPLIIDVDLIIESYNKNNPDKRQMTRSQLANYLGVNIQLFSDWKNGKTPRWAHHLIKLIEIGKLPAEKFIVES